MTSSFPCRILVSFSLALALASTAVAQVAQRFVNFESPQVRPIAISSDGTRLFAVNTADKSTQPVAHQTPTR